MRRRDFLKTTSTLLAATAIPGVPAFSAEPSEHGRRIFPINRGWRYHPGKVDGAEAVTFNDSAFQRVVVPHTNVLLPWHSFDDKTYEFISTYRRRFKTPPGSQGKRVFVDFEGVMTASTVWINGVLLGDYKGGFTPFSFELTPHLRPTGDNVLVVQVDSTSGPISHPSATRSTISPLAESIAKSHCASSLQPTLITSSRTPKRY